MLTRLWPMPVLILVLCVCGCASVRPAPVSMPPDFGVSLTLLGVGAGAPAWYVVGADSGLRAGHTARTVDAAPPPVVRVLSRAEAEGVWQRAQGLASRDALVRIADEATALPRSPTVRYGAVVLSCTSRGATRTFLIPAPPDGHDDSPWRAGLGLAQHLRTLAEARDPTLPQ
jgi:hypothetical protein